MIEIEELVEKSKHGDKDAYTELILLVQNDLQRKAIMHLKNEEDAKDAVQNTIISAYKNITNLKENKYFKTWITRILINECNRLYEKDKKEIEALEKYGNENLNEEYSNELADFDNMIKSLDDKKKEIFELYYKDGLGVKDVAKRMGMSEDAVKSSLKRGRNALREKLKHPTFIILILCLFITTTVIAVSIVKYIMNMFDVNSVGVQNDGILMAIEDMNWYQHVDMDYKDLGDGYKIKLEYLLMDEMNLYLIFDLQSETDISKFKSMSISDLKITNENNELICDLANPILEQAQKTVGDKLIEKDNKHMKLLMYMYTDSFPISNTLDISFSKLRLYTKKKVEIMIQKENSFKVDLDDKFINRKYIEYKSDDEEVEKAILTETGLYIIFENNNIEDEKIELIDEDNNQYNCFVNHMSYDSQTNFKHIAVANMRNKGDTVILRKRNKEIKLIKKEEN